MKKIIVVVFVFLAEFSFASFEMNQNMKAAYQDIMHLELAKAKVRLEKESKINASNGFIPLLYNYIDFYTIIISEDEKVFHQSKADMEKRIDIIAKNDKNSPYYLYAQAEIYLQSAFAKLKFQEYTTAAYQMREAYQLLVDNQKKYPSFKLNQKGLGILHIVFGAVPDRYQWILNLASVQGNIPKGLKELDIILLDKSYNLYEIEVLFLVSFLQNGLTKDQKLCQNYLDRIGTRYKENILLNFTASRLLYQLGRNDECIKVLESKPISNTALRFYYMDYLLGLSYLYRLDYLLAQEKFSYFVKYFKGKDYIKSAYQKMAWIAFLQGNKEAMMRFLKQVQNCGRSLLDADKVAQQESENQQVSPIPLLKARLLYDGGYYQKAKEELLVANPSKSFVNYLDEYWYRLARIESKLGTKSQQVILNYLKVIEIGQNNSKYFVPMSALQIGLIYENQQEYAKAKLYFDKALSYSDFDYETGIHRQAKAGLNRINNESQE